MCYRVSYTLLLDWIELLSMEEDDDDEEEGEMEEEVGEEEAT